jgi:hypothetical protein
VNNEVTARVVLIVATLWFNANIALLRRTDE